MRTRGALELAIKMFGPSAALQVTTSEHTKTYAVGELVSGGQRTHFVERASGPTWERCMLQAMSAKLGTGGLPQEELALDGEPDAD